MHARLDAVLLDVGGTLVEEAVPETAVADLRVRLLPEVSVDVRALAGWVRLGAVTNTAVMGEAEVRHLLAPSGLSDRLSVVVTSADAGAAKPDPRPLRVAMERLGLTDPTRVLYVGDQPSDRAAAGAAGMPYTDAARAGGVGAAVAGWLRGEAGARFSLAAAVAAGRRPDARAEAAAAEHHDRLTKPRGALGRLEAAGIQLAGLYAESPPPVPAPAAVAVFAGDHGVVAEGVTPWPQEVTAQMVANFCAGGAAVNVLARHTGVEVLAVDVGVATPLPAGDGLLLRKVRSGTANLATGPALSDVDARLALDVGAEVAERLAAAGARVLLTGDMGIGNTTPSAALIAAFTGGAPAAVTGRGTGIDDRAWARKVSAVERGLSRLAPGADPVTVLAEVGGLEIAALAGFVVGGAAAGLPVIVDGVIACAGVLAASRLVPGVERWCIAGHRSTEPGAAAALGHLGLVPLLDLDLRLGEGSGAVLALPILQAAAKVLREMATFDAAGVTDKASGEDGGFPSG